MSAHSAGGPQEEKEAATCLATAVSNLDVVLYTALGMSYDMAALKQVSLLEVTPV